MNNSQRSVTHSQNNDYRTIEQTMEKLSGGTRRLAAQLTTSATFNSLWNVLTDYDRLNLYIPYLLSSRKIYKMVYSQAKVIAGGLAHIPIVIGLFYLIMTFFNKRAIDYACLLYTSPSPRD